MLLFEVLITDMLVICGANENENIRLDGIRLGWVIMFFICARNEYHF